MLVAIVEDWFQHNLFRSNLGPLPSWVFMSSSTTKRTSSNHGIMGDEGVESVASGNIIAARVALLCMVAVIRNATGVRFGLISAPSFVFTMLNRTNVSNVFRGF